MIDTTNTIPSDLADEFFADFEEAHQNCEQILLSLEHTPADRALTDDLFRIIHSIKGNLTYIGLKHLSPLLQSLEDVLEELRGGKLEYDDMLSDVVLISLDKTRALINEGLYHQPADLDERQLELICRAIHQISLVLPAQQAQAIYEAVLALDPDTHLLPPNQQDNDITPCDFNLSLVKLGVHTSPDLDFIANLVPAIEQRSPFWQGRTRRIAKLALLMNQYADQPAEPTQLLAAVYMHDISMAFLPLEVLHKEGPLNHQEKQQVNGHVRLSHDLLKRMQHWQDAAEMVLQHHEFCNGQGYPKGLIEEEICPGAKILAIVGTFDACSHARAHHKELRRPVIRAALEVNRHAGSQFSQYWVDIFNQVAQQHSLNIH